MQTSIEDENQVTKSDLLDLATWNRPRNSAELQSFLKGREEALAGSEEELLAI